jgi:hypothetical protein
VSLELENVSDYARRMKNMDRDIMGHVNRQYDWWARTMMC